MSYDGNLISELGFKKYLNGLQNQSSSNIKINQNLVTLNKRWRECNFGCHGPAYRVNRKYTEWNGVLRAMDRLDPFVAGIVDGIKHETVDKINNIVSGIDRTGEGLGLQGKEAFNNVGAENWAAVHLIEAVFKRLVEFDLSLMDNPLMQAVTTIVYEYISLIPEDVIFDMIEDNALFFDGGINRSEIVKAIQLKIIEAKPELIDPALIILSSKTERVVGKQVGKKVAGVIAGVIATKIAKSILNDLSGVEQRRIKRYLASLRKMKKLSGGGLGKTLFALLKAQGFLDLAANSSRQLKSQCPVAWNVLRHKLQGADMVYFLIRPMVQEYADRLEILHKNPVEFTKMMASLIEAKRTKDIFYPTMQF